jgi:hypothetical protein
MENKAGTSRDFLSPQAMADLLCTLMILCHGTDSNSNPFWAYVCIKPSMAKLFKEARERGNFKLEDYGAIIESGEGYDVPPEVMERMERDYGVNHNFENDLIKVIDAHAEHNDA